MSNFELWKRQALQKLDKSFKGEIDEKVTSLCNTINQRKDMFTLSSCSGRIVLQKDTLGKKVEQIWELVSHEEVSLKEIQKTLNKSSDNLVFMQNSCIMHIGVETTELARSLIHTARTCGFNHAGIIASKTKIIVEIICDARIELPLFNQECELENDFLEKLLQRANANLHKSWNCIVKLEQKLQNG